MALNFSKNERIHVCFTSELKNVYSILYILVKLGFIWCCMIQFDLLFRRCSWFFWRPVVPGVVLACWPRPWCGGGVSGPWGPGVWFLNDLDSCPKQLT